MKLPFLKKTSPEKKFEKTLAEYLKIAEKSPEDYRIHVKIAELYLENNKKDKAIEEYMIAAKGYANKRLFQIAIAIYSHILAIDSHQIEVYSTLAELHQKNGFQGDAVAVLEKLAHYYYEKNMKYEAIQVLKKITEIDPRNEFFKIKVSKFYQTKNLDDKEALNQGPKDKWNLMEADRSTHNASLQEPASGTFDLEAALQDDEVITFSITSEEVDNEESIPPEDAKNNQLSFDGIFDELKDSMETSPDQDSPVFHYNLGVAYQQMNRHEEALEEYKIAIDDLEKKSDCYLRLATCMRSLRRFDEAEQYIKEGLALPALIEEEKLELNYELGLIHKAKGDKNAALKTFKKIFETDKNFKSVSNEIQELSK